MQDDIANDQLSLKEFVDPFTGEKAKKIQIKNAEGTVTNTLVIENGKADMISADCPDKLCVNQHAISSNGETIVCLPNKVVVEVEDGEEAQFDTQTK